MSVVINADFLVDLISGHKFAFSTEEQLHQCLAQLMQEQGIQFEPEVKLNARDRIDFMVGSVGIEVKIKHPLSSVLRQLHRYAQCPEIDELLLISTRAPHALTPTEINGKQVKFVFLGWGMLG